MSWVGFIELGLFFLLAGLMLWVFFKPTKKNPKQDEK